MTRLDTNRSDDAFRAEVRAFLDASLTDELREAGRKKTSIWQEPVSAAAWQKIRTGRDGWYRIGPRNTAAKTGP